MRPPLPAPHGVRGIPDVERHHPPGDELLNRLELRIRTQLLGLLRFGLGLDDRTSPGFRLGWGGVIVGDVSLERGVLRVHGRRLVGTHGAVDIGGEWGAQLVVQAHRAVTTGIAPSATAGQHRTTSHRSSLSVANRHPHAPTRVLTGSKSSAASSGA